MCPHTGTFHCSHCTYAGADITAKMDLLSCQDLDTTRLLDMKLLPAVYCIETIHCGMNK